MFARIIGVFKLDSKTFEEIEHNPSLTLPVALIVVFVSLLSGVGNWLNNVVFVSLLNGVGNWLFKGLRIGGTTFASGFLSSLIGVVVGWLIWSFATWFVGTRLFKGQADLGEMLRVIGFAYTPLVLSIIPCVGWVIGVIWALVAGFIAIRQGLDLDNMKAFFTMVVSAALYIILMVISNTLI
jgi:hypothetical protein